MTRQLIVTLASAIAVTLLTPARASAQISDETLAGKVITVVRAYSQLGIFDDVSVTVADRAVTLAGEVTTGLKRAEIGTRVAKIDGARSVTNNIQVLPASTSDAGLRLRLAQAIYTHPAFWGYAAMACPPIHIIVANGYVRLTGVVNSELERTLAYALAQVDGVQSVRNDLRVDLK
jgi:osmotically-inducible protein OsmY